MTRPTPLSRQVEDLRSELELLRSAQDRMFNVARQTAVLSHCSLEVLGHKSPARYELCEVVQCKVCDDLVIVKDIGYGCDLSSRQDQIITGR